MCEVRASSFTHQRRCASFESQCRCASSKSQRRQQTGIALKPPGGRAPSDPARPPTARAGYSSPRARGRAPRAWRVGGAEPRGVHARRHGYGPVCRTLRCVYGVAGARVRSAGTGGGGRGRAPWARGSADGWRGAERGPGVGCRTALGGGGGAEVLVGVGAGVRAGCGPLKCSIPLISGHASSPAPGTHLAVQDQRGDSAVRRRASGGSP